MADLTATHPVFARLGDFTTCMCGVGYMERDLIDPACQFHDFKEFLTEVVVPLLGASDEGRQLLAMSMGLLNRAIHRMNEAVVMTTSFGPAHAMEYIADYLNETDSIDEGMADVPHDWLTRWTVSRAGT